MTAPLVLITRPRPEAEAMASRLAARGYRCLIEPMLEIVPCAGPPLELTGVQALLVTSGNGARTLANRTPARGVKVFAVGDATAATLIGLGFEAVESAGGDVRHLAALVQKRCDPRRGPLLHIRGDAVATDPGTNLQEAGFSVRASVLYESRTPSAFSPELERTLRRHGLAFALFFSPRSGRTFVTLARAAGVAPHCETIEAYCLSAAIAAALREVPWRAVQIAVRPEEGALLALLPRLTNGTESRGEHGG